MKRFTGPSPIRAAVVAIVISSRIADWRREVSMRLLALTTKLRIA
jgi:hypothetical protein